MQEKIYFGNVTLSPAENLPISSNKIQFCHFCDNGHHSALHREKGVQVVHQCINEGTSCPKGAMIALVSLEKFNSEYCLRTYQTPNTQNCKQNSTSRRPLCDLSAHLVELVLTF
jgi:hypothetical protein